MWRCYLLPFKTYNTSESVELVSDHLGNSLEVPKYGCVTYNEFDCLERLMIQARTELSDDPAMPMSEVERRQIAMLLRLRFKLAADVADADILRLPNGLPFPQPLIKALKAFFDRELKAGVEEGEAADADEKKSSIGENCSSSCASTTPTKKPSTGKTSPTSP